MALDLDQSIDIIAGQINGQETAAVDLALTMALHTTASNAVVAPIHPMAMPVILTTDEERDVWLRAVG